MMTSRSTWRIIGCSNDEENTKHQLSELKHRDADHWVHRWPGYGAVRQPPARGRRRPAAVRRPGDRLRKGAEPYGHPSGLPSWDLRAHGDDSGLVQVARGVSLYQIMYNGVLDTYMLRFGREPRYVSGLQPVLIVLTEDLS